MVYVDNNATLFHILATNKHYDKRPMNALVAKAVEVCDQKKLCYLIYGQFTYGNKDQSSLAEFKRRNGFEQINFPRYYVPLTLKGRCFLRLGFHKGIMDCSQAQCSACYGRREHGLIECFFRRV